LIAILDYGSGNIRSAQRAFERVGVETKVTSDRKDALAAHGLVVPGVGAFSSCIKQLREIGGDEVVRERVATSRPILGICVGMQILFESSSEGGEDSLPGLAILTGKIERLNADVLPHMGWNQVKSDEKSALFQNLSDESFYFVHSYALIDTPNNLQYSTSEYGGKFISAVEAGPISAVQFHPEKSGAAGLKLLSNWVNSI
jgi:glutamine amidotransferase